MFKKFSFVLLVLLFLFSSMSSFAETKPGDGDIIYKGHMEYKARCMHCHGENADGKGHLVEVLKITPANLTSLKKSSLDGCVSEKVMKAVLGRHRTSAEGAKMTLLKDIISLENVYFISEYIKSIQK